MWKRMREKRRCGKHCREITAAAVVLQAANACAGAIVAEEAPVNACPVGGDEAAAKIAGILGKRSEKDQTDDRFCTLCRYL